MAEEEPAEFSWRAVSWIYLGGCALLAAFAAGQFVLEVKAVEGFWLIFAFFPLCLVYSVRKNACAERREAAQREEYEERLMEQTLSCLTVCHYFV